MTFQHGSDIPAVVSYRSGAAARLAGVPVETLRVWERRYGVVSPNLSPRGQRLYSPAEVRRIALIKQLVDTGHAIGMIASLSTDDLIAMREAAPTLAGTRGRARAGADASRPARIALTGPLVSKLRLEEAAVVGTLNVVGRCMNLTDAAKLLGGVQADIALIELPTLNDESLGIVAGVKQACGAERAIVLYRFAPSAAIRRLRDAGHQVVHVPSDTVEIAAICTALLHSPQERSTKMAPDGGSLAPRPRQFDELALTALAAASSSVYCECPRHLVELVRSLGSFEHYSAECANRGPADAALHRDLQCTAARARAMLEDALLRVAIAEGLPVPTIKDAGASDV